MPTGLRVAMKVPSSPATRDPYTPSSLRGGVPKRRPGGRDVLEVEQVLDIELVAAFPAGHPLADRDRISLRELSDERLILFSRGFHPRSYDYVVACCRGAGFEPKVVQRKEPQLYSGAATYRMVASGIGVGIVARPMVSGHRPYGVVFKPLRDPSPALELVAAWWRDNLSSNLQAFLEIVRELTTEGDRSAAPPDGHTVLGA